MVLVSHACPQHGHWAALTSRRFRVRVVFPMAHLFKGPSSNTIIDARARGCPHTNRSHPCLNRGNYEIITGSP